MGATRDPTRDGRADRVAGAALPFLGCVTRCGVDLADRVHEGARADEFEGVVARDVERGVLLRPIGNTVYFMPPYILGDDDAAFLAAGLLVADVLLKWLLAPSWASLLRPCLPG